MGKPVRLGIAAAALTVAFASGYEPTTACAEVRSWEDAVESRVPESAELVELGRQVYGKACVHCHGEGGDGKGKGERFLYTKPRILADGEFKIRSTPTGSLPTDEDLFRSISVGFPVYGMPRFEYLTSRERWGLVYYIKTLSPRFQEDEPEASIDIGQALPSTPATLARGRKFFEEMQCGRCHGDEGKGDGPSAAELRDAGGQPARIMDLTQEEEAFKRGARARDIMFTFMTGLNGTPMPSYADVLSLEENWALARYIESLVGKEHSEGEAQK